MQPETYKKRLLRHLGKTNPDFYLLSANAKKELDFPQQCCLEPQRIDRPIVSLDCEMVITINGPEAVSICIVDSQEKPILQEFFKPKEKILDYQTAITGLTERSFEHITQTFDDILPKVIEIIKGTIVVGHDLSNDLNVLRIGHQEFIDTANLFPHNQGLPFKTKLKQLVLNFLKIPIQYGAHDPREDAKATLKLVKKYIGEGRGLVEFVEDVAQTPFGLENICRMAELDHQKVLLLILRGSRAGGFHEETSDYDYVLVYDTNTCIDGGLIKLYNVDIAIFDKKSFERLLNIQDISIFQIFFNGNEHQLRNSYTLPVFDLMRLRESTTHHVYKALNKSRRFFRAGNYKKALKCIHMAYRFYDYYDQFATFGSISEHRRIVPLWLRMRDEFYSQKINPYHLYSTYLENLQKFANDFRKKYPTIKRVHQQFKNPTCKKAQRRKVQMDKKYDEVNLAGEDLNILHYLRENGSKYLEDDYRVRINTHVKYPNIIQLHYLQSANFFFAIARECRGIILDIDKNYKIVAFPYFKFFDYNDKNCDMEKFCWEKSELFYKLDGSTATLYFYDGQWHVASSTKPDGDGQYCFAQESKTTTFAQQFWRVFYSNNYKLPSEADQDKTFIFELLSTRHLIVVNHQKDRLVLHGVRHIPSLKEVEVQTYDGKYGWQVIKPVDIKYKCLQDVIKEAQKLDPRIQQGFILKDYNNMRVKVKSSKYLLLNWSNPLNNNLINDRTLLELIIKNQHKIFIEYCPQWRTAIETLYNRLESTRTYIFKQIQTYGEGLSDKQFAKKVSKEDRQVQPIFYSIRKGQVKPDDFYQTVPMKRLSYLLQTKPQQAARKQTEQNQQKKLE